MMTFYISLIIAIVLLQQLRHIGPPSGENESYNILKSTCPIRLRLVSNPIF